MPSAVKLDSSRFLENPACELRCIALPSGARARNLFVVLAQLVPAKIALIHHRDLHDLVRRFEGITTALWRDTLIDAAIFREWMVGIGRRSAHQRIAHVLCEMATKLRAVGLNDGHTYPWPVTQQDDALGLTDVHVNRVLRDIRQAGLITLERGAFTALDWEELKQLGEFDPTYLHIERSIAA